MTDNTIQAQLDYFLHRLDAYATSDLIREIIRAIRTKQSQDSLLSDEWEDIDVGVDFPDFYVENFRLPLVEMKGLLYKWLEIIRSGSHEYVGDIENIDATSMRIVYLLKFKKVKDESGSQKHICESLTDGHRRLCFIQFCSPKDCSYIIRQIDNAISLTGYDHKPFEENRANVVIEISPPWFKIGNFSNDNYMGIRLESARQLIQEWIYFIDT
ncbi:MAG: hypothetical protein EOO89_32130 [Pedobacter sp.]|nr:MAG: hypothetical protein EOO89_32130 [Pedobacter sp.]